MIKENWSVNRKNFKVVSENWNVNLEKCRLFRKFKILNVQKKIGKLDRVLR